MRLRFGGRHPLCGTGVTSEMLLIFRPSAFSARTADSRPGPGPLMRTSRFLTPHSCAARPADSAATCAANGVDLREPLKPAPPDVAHDSAFPWRSVIVMIVLLKDAWMCAIPSDTLFLTFLRARAAAAFCEGSCAMRGFPFLVPLGLRRRRPVERDLPALLRALSRARVRARALAADRQSLAVAHAPVTAEVHQPLDAHRHLAAEVALDGELADVLAQLVHLRVGQVLDLRARRHAGGDADRLRARPADAVDRRQRDLGVLVVRNVDACNACHGLPVAVDSLVAFSPAAACAAHRPCR